MNASHATRLLAIVGPTASGKTAAAVAAARALGGEIVNGDSRAFYRGMDIGTAKPTPDERAAVPHWLIDIADPDEAFTLARFVDEARAVIDDIVGRGRVPLLAGGTGQYVWALLEGWRVPRVPPDRDLRAKLEARAARHGPASLVEELRRLDPASAANIDPRNVRRLIRAIEVTRATGRPFSEARRRDRPPYDATIVGLDVPRDVLYERIDRRVDSMIAAGLLDEVRGLIAAGYGCDLPTMQSIGYRQVCEHLAGACTLDETIARIKTETHRLARMQRTWFRRDDPRIHWIDATAPDAAEQAVAAFMRGSAQRSRTTRAARH